MSSVCIACHSPKASFTCGICNEQSCRKCTLFLNEDSFPYLDSRPDELAHDTYCPRCFDSTVQPALDEHHTLLQKARNVVVIPKKYRGHVAVLKKGKDIVTIKSRPDRRDVLMRLAIKAVDQGFNALIQTEVVSKKWRDNAYQKMEWSGQALPANVDPRLADDYRDENNSLLQEGDWTNPDPDTIF